MRTQRLTSELQRVYRQVLTVLQPQSAGAVWTAEVADRVGMARILHAERHALCQSDVRPLDRAGDASALRAN